jgi:para-nitrobenzyl esterase
MMMRKPIRLVVTTALIVGLAGAACAQMMPIASDPVTTDAGRVSGTLLPSGVQAYLGIPYAKPPVQALRWQAPQPVTWQGIFNADRKPAECTQVLRPHNINHYFGEEKVSEDCLYLSIWKPASATATSKLPVIVFIYGGGGTVGSSSPALYDGEAVAKQGAIYVNLNYRVGLMGFMSHPALSKEQGGHSGNYGYLDQNAALRWVHDNIAAFGGDPAKVLITGQSFGAGSVAAQIASPLSKGLFRAAAMWSACNYDSPAVPLAEAEKLGEQVQSRLGAASLADMRNAPADKILALQEEHQLGANVHGLSIPPTIDGYFWTRSKKDALAAHMFNDVPIIASSNGDDIDASRNPLVATHTVADYTAMAQKMYGKDADAFLRLYPVKVDADVQPMAHRAAWEGGMLHSSQSCGLLQAQYNKQPTYIDLFLHKHPYAPGVVIADQNTATIGAYHTADVPYWLGTFDAFNMFRQTRAWTAQDAALSQVMMGSLIALADTGSPSTPRFTWPAWSAKQQRYAAFKDGAMVEVMAEDRMAWLTAHPAAPVVVQPQRSAATRD